MQRPFPREPRRRTSGGFSLIELMISVALGLMVVAALAVLFANSSRARTEMEKSNQQIENGRYATQLLRDDLRLAGYVGEFNPASLTPPAAVPDPSLTDVASITDAMTIPVQGYHFGISASSTLPTGVTSLLTDLRPRSDVLVIRRASTCVAGPITAAASCAAMDASSHYYFQTTLCQSQLSVLPTASQFVISANSTVFTTTNSNITATPTFLAQKDCATPAATRAYLVRIYYVANNDVAGDGIPTLKRLELGAGSFNAAEPIAEGIESLQLEYGVDDNNDGAPEGYYSDPPTAGKAWSKVTAVKVHLLARNTEASPTFNDTRTYVLGGSATTDNTFGPYNDHYKRHVYTSVVRVMNVGGRLE
jgi:type IV pilus assembly protein PilW